MNLGRGEPLRLRVRADRSVVEVFGNSRQFLTSRTGPEGEDSFGVSILAGGSAANFSSKDREGKLWIKEQSVSHSNITVFILRDLSRYYRVRVIGSPLPARRRDCPRCGACARARR
ncbi:MAG: GH32 C-terminal domain-containing protein [Chloroflexi bacterium]|nr:GH32 C-terminal domain-containing protein [Chloroflexota bacterium]